MPTKTTLPKIDQRPETHYLGIRTQVTLQEMGSGIIPQLHGEIMQWMQQQGAAPAGAPFMRYHIIDMSKKLDIELGWTVAQSLPGNERITAGVIPAGRYASLIYTGIDNGIEGNRVLIEWAKDNGIAWDRWDDPKGDGFRSRIETFLTDPADEPDMAKWETEVAIKLAE
jgi:effector-binding domain-containing protein